MATVRSSASGSIVSILTTINASAQSIAKTIDAASDSVDMLTAYITKAKAEQAKTHIFAADEFDTNLIHEATLARSKREESIEKELQGNPRLSALYQQNHAHFTSLLAPKGA